MGVGATPNANFAVESLHDTPTNDGAPSAGADGNTLSYMSGNDLDAGGFSTGVTGADGHGSSFAITTNAVPDRFPGDLRPGRCWTADAATTGSGHVARRA